MDRYLAHRRGLPNFSRKLAGGSVTIGYLGGSLTMMKAGWRPIFHSWLNKRFPRFAPHRALHVGRGGVGSASGAFFVQDEICGHDPDLIFVDYAINDSYEFLTPPALLLAAIEGIVRNVKLRHPDCEICFIYMHHILRGAEIERAVKCYEKVAEHYGIPSIHAGRYFADLVSSGSWSYTGESAGEVLLRDECHPLPAGNQMLTDLISRSIEDLKSYCDKPIPLPKPLGRTPLEGGRSLPVTPDMLRGPYQERRGHIGNFDGEVSWISLPSKSRLQVRLDGAVVGFYIVVGPNSGIIQATHGAKIPSGTYSTDGATTKGYRLAYSWSHLRHLFQTADN